jgi:hypothetical protein
MKFSASLPILLAPLAAYALTIPYPVARPITIAEPVASQLSNNTVLLSNTTGPTFCLPGGEPCFPREDSAAPVVPVAVVEKPTSRFQKVKNGLLRILTWAEERALRKFRRVRNILRVIRDGRFREERRNGRSLGRALVLTEGEIARDA